MGVAEVVEDRFDVDGWGRDEDGGALLGVTRYLCSVLLFQDQRPHHQHRQLTATQRAPASFAPFKCGQSFASIVYADYKLEIGCIRHF